MFFGVPHRGSDYANLGLMAKDIALAVGFSANDANLRDLKPNAEYAQMLNSEFGKMLIADPFDIDTFQEAFGFKGIRGLSGKVSFSFVGLLNLSTSTS